MMISNEAFTASCICYFMLYLSLDFGNSNKAFSININKVGFIVMNCETGQVRNSEINDLASSLFMRFISLGCSSHLREGCSLLRTCELHVNVFTQLWQGRVSRLRGSVGHAVYKLVTSLLTR